MLCLGFMFSAFPARLSSAFESIRFPNGLPHNCGSLKYPACIFFMCGSHILQTLMTQYWPPGGAVFTPSECAWCTETGLASLSGTQDLDEIQIWIPGSEVGS